SVPCRCPPVPRAPLPDLSGNSPIGWPAGSARHSSSAAPPCILPPLPPSALLAPGITRGCTSVSCTLPRSRSTRAEAGHVPPHLPCLSGLSQLPEQLPLLPIELGSAESAV